MPFVSECGASFAKFGDLSKHVKTQIGARLFPCPECGSTFTASSHLKSHMTIHSGEKPFSCKDCDATFARPCQQKSHTIRKHTSLTTLPLLPVFVRFSDPVGTRRAPADSLRDQAFHMQGVQRHLLLSQLPEEARPANTHPSRHAALPVLRLLSGVQE